MTTSAPPPCRLALLSQLKQLDKSTKVRFLGCVHSYDIPSATLTLRTKYPSTAADHDVIHVDINQILDSTAGSNLQVGAWVNVMGYVTSSKPKPIRAEQSNVRRGSSQRKRCRTKPVRVQAIAIWTAGNVDLTVYEESVKRYQSGLPALSSITNSTAIGGTRNLEVA
ncbi:hypothetical protein LTR66_006354 [Elasticomyces elasticus]|nr:hypothetical protein LTR50_003534 [Elasticomyces elasticus]KAK4992190.1 hypothetical protein LTR66_006354 [Elasticomyces elasticus]